MCTQTPTPIHARTHTQQQKLKLIHFKHLHFSSQGKNIDWKKCLTVWIKQAATYFSKRRELLQLNMARFRCNGGLKAAVYLRLRLEQLVEYFVAFLCKFTCSEMETW